MFGLDNVLDFSKTTDEDLFVISGKILKNIEGIERDINKISYEDNEDFAKIYMGCAGGHIRPILVSTKLLREFITAQKAIAVTIYNKATDNFTNECDE